jgi:predicted TIM-barrel fold metal-dependent hydrolase
MSKGIDTHVHVFDIARFPFQDSRGFDLLPNEPGTAHQLAGVLDSHGMSHAVLVNPLGGYGTDNRYMLQAIAEGGGRYKGICLLPSDASDADVAHLVKGGVVGLRFNLGFPKSPPLHGPEGERALGRARELGWVVQVHYRATEIVEALPILRKITLPVVIDHAGRPDLDQGLAQPGFAALLELGREGRAVIKLSAIFRYSKMGWPYRDVDPYIEALIKAFTVERCVWGSDWPFLRAGARIDYGPLLTCLRRWFPDARDQQRILWDNPARLFGFS